MSHYYPDMDDSIPDPNDVMSRSAIQRWKRQFVARAEAILADLEDSRYDQAVRHTVLSYRDAALNNGEITRIQRELVNTLYNLRSPKECQCRGCVGYRLHFEPKLRRK